MLRASLTDMSYWSNGTRQRRTGMKRKCANEKTTRRRRRTSTKTCSGIISMHRLQYIRILSVCTRRKNAPSWRENRLRLICDLDGTERILFFLPRRENAPSWRENRLRLICDLDGTERILFFL